MQSGIHGDHAQRKGFGWIPHSNEEFRVGAVVQEEKQTEDENENENEGEVCV